jgi:hypothetical protein
MSETDLEIAERKVRETAGHMERQRELITELHNHGFAQELIDLAESLLAKFATIHAEHVAHLQEMRKEARR